VTQQVIPRRDADGNKKIKIFYFCKSLLKKYFSTLFVKENVC
jgi:hypothetical protein